jgi:hypothetical protein
MPKFLGHSQILVIEWKGKRDILCSSFVAVTYKDGLCFDLGHGSMYFVVDHSV